MSSDALRQAGIAALVSMFIGIVPLGMGVVYAIWPTEQRLALMRPCRWPPFSRRSAARFLACSICWYSWVPATRQRFHQWWR